MELDERYLLSVKEGWACITLCKKKSVRFVAAARNVGRANSWQETPSASARRGKVWHYRWSIALLQLGFIIQHAIGLSSPLILKHILVFQEANNKKAAVQSDLVRSASWPRKQTIGIFPCVVTSHIPDPNVRKYLE